MGKERIYFLFQGVCMRCFMVFAGIFSLGSQTLLGFLTEEQTPALFTAFTIAQENNMVRVRDTLSYRMQEEVDSMHCIAVQGAKPRPNCSTDKQDVYVWLDGMGDALHQDSTHKGATPIVGYQSNMGGAVLGVDYRFADICYVGLMGSYTGDSVKWQEDLGKGHIQTGYGGVYFSALGNLLYTNLSVIGGWNHYSGHRSISFPGEQFSAHNKHGGVQLLSHIDVGMTLHRGWFSLRPFESFDYITQTEQGFTESGADGLDLSVGKNNAILLRNELGFNFAGCICFGASHWTISPKLSWVREVRVKGGAYHAHFVEGGGSIEGTGFFPSRNLVSPGVIMTGCFWDEMFTLSLYYNAELNGNYSSQSYGGQVRFGF